MSVYLLKYTYKDKNSGKTKTTISEVCTDLISLINIINNILHSKESERDIKVWDSTHKDGEELTFNRNTNSNEFVTIHIVKRPSHILKQSYRRKEEIDREILKLYREQKALAYAERYGILKYKVNDNKMVFNVSYPAYIGNPAYTIQHVIDLDKDTETTRQLKRFDKSALVNR